MARQQRRIPPRSQVRKQPAVLDHITDAMADGIDVGGGQRDAVEHNLPLSGWMSPIIKRSSVDLPQPLGPISTVVLRGCGTSDVGARATFAPKVLETFSRESIWGVKGEEVKE